MSELCPYEYMLLSGDAKDPVQASPGAAAIDVFSSKEMVVSSGSTAKIPTDVAFTPPSGSYARTVSRSGLALKRQLIIPADCIDPDYTGGVHIVVMNLGREDYTVRKHERIGSIIFEKYVVPIGRRVSAMEDTTRGGSGFGSTGEM